MLYRKHERIVSMLIGAGMMGIILIAVIVYYQGFKLDAVRNITQKQVKQQFELQNEKKMGQVLILTETVEQGGTIDKAKVQAVRVPLDLIAEDAHKESQSLERKVCRFKIQKGTILADSMLVDEDKMVTYDLRRQDYFNIKKFYALQKGNYVDVRIKRKDGSDDVILAKKEVLDIVDTMLCFNVNESERQYFNAASVEATVEQCEIYTTLYVDPQNQPPAEVTYEINKKVLETMRQNPNIVEEAKKILAERNKMQETTNMNTVNNSTNNPPVVPSGNTGVYNAAVNIPEGSGKGGGSNPTNENVSGVNNQKPSSSFTQSNGQTSGNISEDTEPNNDGWVKVNE